ncbi:MAG TPA: hypothetical protein VGK73_32830, partial [Polyangiaceae bacterium]
MPRKLAIIEIETGEDERLCSDKCAFIAFGNHCGLFEERLVSDGKERPVRCPQCLESTRLASLDRAVEIQPAPTSAGEAVAAGWVARAGDFVSGVRIGDVCLPNPTRVSGTISEFFNFGDKPVAKLMPGVNDGYIVALDSLKPISPPQAARYSCDKCGLPLNSLTLAGSKLCGDCDAELERECGGSLKPDPYARITVAGTESDRLFAIEENIRSHRMQSEDATLDRLAAARRAKLAQT